MKSRRADVSWMFSQLGVMSRDRFVGFDKFSIELVDGISFPESVDLNDIPLPFSEETGDKLCEEKVNNGGGGGMVFCGIGDTGVLGELLRSATVNDLDILRSILFPIFLCHMLVVLSAIKDNNLKYSLTGNNNSVLIIKLNFPYQGIPIYEYLLVIIVIQMDSRKMLRDVKWSKFVRSLFKIAFLDIQMWFNINDVNFFFMFLGCFGSQWSLI